MYVSRSDDKSHEMVIFVKYFESTFVVRIFIHLYNMIFKFMPKSSFESKKKQKLLYVE